MTDGRHAVDRRDGIVSEGLTWECAATVGPRGQASWRSDRVTSGGAITDIARPRELALPAD